MAQPRLAVPRRVMADATVTEGGYMRVHLHPKRFHAVYTTDWKVRRPLRRTRRDGHIGPPLLS